MMTERAEARGRTVEEASHEERREWRAKKEKKKESTRSSRGSRYPGAHTPTAEPAEEQNASKGERGRKAETSDQETEFGRTGEAAGSAKVGNRSRGRADNYIEPTDGTASQCATNRALR
jgi:hypothetical protein